MELLELLELELQLVLQEAHQVDETLQDLEDCIPLQEEQELAIVIEEVLQEVEVEV